MVFFLWHAAGENGSVQCIQIASSIYRVEPVYVFVCGGRERFRVQCKNSPAGSVVYVGVQKKLRLFVLCFDLLFCVLRVFSFIPNCPTDQGQGSAARGGHRAAEYSSPAAGGPVGYGPGQPGGPRTTLRGPEGTRQYLWCVRATSVTCCR